MRGRQERKARRRVDPNTITIRYEVSLPCQRSLPEPRLHDSNEITVPRIPTIPTVSTISTKSRFPRPQRLPRNAPRTISCKPLPSVESWKRWNRGAEPKPPQDCAPAAGHPQKGGLLTQTAVAVPFRWPPSLPPIGSVCGSDRPAYACSPF